jgi:hypothetical protein
MTQVGGATREAPMTTKQAAQRFGLYLVIKCPVCEQGDVLVTRTDVLAGDELGELAQVIIDEISSEYAVKPADLVGPRRFKRLIEPRAICYWRLREQLHMTLAGIGAIFHRDHSTIVHALNQMSHSGQYSGVSQMTTDERRAPHRDREMRAR